METISGLTTHANNPGTPPVIQVVETSRPAVIAQQLTDLMHMNQTAEIQVISAKAVNLAIKAIAIARAAIAHEGIDIISTPQFMNTDEPTWNAVRFIIECRQRR